MNRTELCTTTTPFTNYVVNLLGGPGAGKSTNALLLTGKLKKAGYNAEYTGEYAKDCVWRKAENILEDQIYIFGKQNNRQFRLKNQVQFTITDSPLILNLHYGNHLGPTFKKLALETFNSYNNINFFIERTKVYNPVGRMQTAQESDTIANEVIELLLKNQVPFTRINSDWDLDDLVDLVLKATKTTINPLIVC
jgi:hypothetical protein